MRAAGGACHPAGEPEPYDRCVSEPKTTATTASVADFLAGVADPQRDQASDLPDNAGHPRGARQSGRAAAKASTPVSSADSLQSRLA